MNSIKEHYLELPSKYHRELSIKHHRMIKHFTEQFQQKRQYVDYENTSLLVLSDHDYQGLTESEYIKILHSYQDIRNDQIINNSYGIASLLVHTSQADGVLKAADGVGDFTDYADHAINYCIQQYGTVVAFDCTAGVNIDHNQGNFDVLAIHANSFETLLNKLHHLYGGTWNPLSKEDIEYIYFVEYPDFPKT